MGRKTKYGLSEDRRAEEIGAGDLRRELESFDLNHFLRKNEVRGNGLIRENSKVRGLASKTLMHGDLLRIILAETSLGAGKHEAAQEKEYDYERFEEERLFTHVQ